MLRATSSVPFAKMFEETELFTDLKLSLCLIGQFMRRAELYFLAVQNSSMPNLVLVLSSNFFSRRLDPTIPYKHSETGMTLLIWPWPAKIPGEDLSLVSQTLLNLPGIPLRTLWISEDLTDVPLAFGDTLLIHLLQFLTISDNFDNFWPLWQFWQLW